MSESQSTRKPVLERTKTQGLWLAALGFALVLLLLAVFLLQNGQSVEVSYLGAHGHMSLAVAMLFSAVAGALLLGFAGAARNLQLRRVARRRSRIVAPTE